MIENWNSANGFIFYGRGGELASNSRDAQERSLLSLHLVQNCLVYSSTLMLPEVLGEPGWLERMKPDDLRALTPLIDTHVNPYGLFRRNMEERLPLQEGVAGTANEHRRGRRLVNWPSSCGLSGRTTSI